MRRGRRRLNIRTLGALAAIVVLAVFAGYAGVKYGLSIVFGPSLFHGDTDDPDASPGRMNLLLIGIDSADVEEMTRADSLLFVSTDAEAERVAMLSIPRDTRVNIPGHGWNKINAATVYGGPELACRVVSELIGQPIDYYVLTNFDGFRDIVDILGGVTIEVERRMYYRDPMADPPLVIDLHPGVQQLDGEKALQYVRYRGDNLGDITRTQRQQKFLMALADEVLKPGTIVKLPRLVPKISACVETNLDIREMLRWANFARKLGQMEMLTATLPGTFADLNGLSYWYVDPYHAKEAAAKLIRGEEIGGPVDERLASLRAVACQAGEAEPVAGAGAPENEAAEEEPPVESTDSAKPAPAVPVDDNWLGDGVPDDVDHEGDEEADGDATAPAMPPAGPPEKPEPPGEPLLPPVWPVDSGFGAQGGHNDGAADAE